MTPERYFLMMVLGGPLALLLIATIGAYFHREGIEHLLDWKPTRSLTREVSMRRGETQQLLEAVNRRRRARGAPERTLEECLQAAVPSGGSGASGESGETERAGN